MHSDHSTTVFEDTPKDRYHFVYLTFLFLGMAILLPWNSLVTALDYFTNSYQDHDVEFVVSIVSNGPMFATSILMIILAPYFPNKKTIVVTMFLMMLLTLALPFFPEYIPSIETSWIFTLVTIILISCINGIMQC